MPTSPLEYALPPRGVNGRRWIRGTIFVLLLCALLFFIVNREEIIGRIRLLQAQRHIMNYSAPSDQPVLTTDPNQANKLTGRSWGYIQINGKGAAIRPEQIWKDYINLVGEKS